jgi:hypothetical protein
MGMTLHFLGILFGFLLFVSTYAQAEVPSWKIKPSVCVNSMSGTSCEFNIEIFAANLPDGQYCLYRQQHRLRCLAHNGFPIKLTVSLQTQSSLLLKDAGDQVILSQILSVKSLTAKKQRRRLRSPWSLF